MIATVITSNTITLTMTVIVEDVTLSITLTVLARMMFMTKAVIKSLHEATHGYCAQVELKVITKLTSFTCNSLKIPVKESVIRLFFQFFLYFGTNI